MRGEGGVDDWEGEAVEGFGWAEGVEDFELGVDDEGEVGWERGGCHCVASLSA